MHHQELPEPKDGLIGIASPSSHDPALLRTRVVSGLVTKSATAVAAGATVSIPALKLSAVTDEEGSYSPHSKWARQGPESRLTSLCRRGAKIISDAGAGRITKHTPWAWLLRRVTVGSGRRVAAAELRSGGRADRRRNPAKWSSETTQISSLAPCQLSSAPSRRQRSVRPAPARPRPRPVLVMITGKRRHAGELVHGTGPRPWSTGVDITAIPAPPFSGSRCCATAPQRSTARTRSPA